jgi:RsiW-degrading membrane proteinase PrsW (M82 family)
MEIKQNLTNPKYIAIIFVVVFVTTKQLIRHYNKEALPTIDLIMDMIFLVLFFFASTFKINDITKGTQSTLSEPFRIAIFALGIGLLLLKSFLNFENVFLIKNQIPLINTAIFGLISFNYFNVVVTEEKRKMLINFLKYLLGFIALANLSTIIF